MDKISKETSAGALFALLGAAFAIYAYSTLRVGTAFRMGPGFFPVVLGSLLFAFGVVIILVSLRTRAESWGPVPWRALMLIPGSLVVFGLLARPLGMVLGLLVMSMMAAFASRHMTIRNALLLSIAMTAFCVLLFGFILRVPLPLWGSLLQH